MVSICGCCDIFVAEVGSKGNRCNAETGEHGADAGGACKESMLAPGVMLSPRILEVGHYVMYERKGVEWRGKVDGELMPCFSMQIRTSELFLRGNVTVSSDKRKFNKNQGVFIVPQTPVVCAEDTTQVPNGAL